jgi:hypothetical protein
MITSGSRDWITLGCPAGAAQALCIKNSMRLLSGLSTEP